MPILDFSLPSSTQLLMGDGTPLNLLPALDGFRIEQPLVDPSLDQPLIWTGQITLVDVVGFPESLDKVANYSRWQRGKHPIRLYLYGNLIATLRIKSYFYDPEAGIAQIEVTDKLGLLNFDRPESSSGDFRSVSFTRGEPRPGGSTVFFRTASRRDTIRKTLVNGSKLNGVQYLADGDILVSDLPSKLPNSFDRNGNQREDSFSAEQGEGKTNPVRVAQQMAGAIGYFMWMDAQERVRFTPYPVSSNTPIRRYSRAEVEEFKPKEVEDPDSEAFAAVEVVGRTNVSTKTLDPDDPEDQQLLPPGFGTSFPQIQYVKAAGVTIQQITRNATFSANAVTRQTTTTARLDSIPDIRERYPNNGGFITQEAREESESYDAQGYLLTRLTNVQQPMGSIAPDLYPGVTAPATSALITETWTYDRGVPTRHEIITQRPAYAVFGNRNAGSSLVFAEGLLEEWTPLAAEQFQFYQVKTKPKGALVTVPGNPFDTTPSLDGSPIGELVDAPPSPPTLPADSPRIPQIAKDGVEVAADGETPFAGSKFVLEVDFCPRGAVKPLAAMLAQLSWQRREPWLVSRPFDPRCDLNFKPFQREDVHHKSLIRDGFTLVIGEDGLSVSYTGNHLGDIPVIPVPYEPPPLPASPVLAIAPIADLTFTVGMPISPIQLAAAGGSPPYSFSATSLPVGLILESGVISGTPTALGVSTVTAAVTDAALATASDEALFTVAAVPAVVQYWQQVARVEDGSYDQERLRRSSSDSLAASDGSYSRESAAVYVGVVLFQQEYRETYTSGKVPVSVSRGFHQWRSNTPPSLSGGTYTFTLCDGSTTTLSPTLGGELSAVYGTRTIVGVCS